jgi:hypothetical protein
VSCIADRRLIAETENKTYALNGAALGVAAEEGWTDWREADNGSGSPGRIVQDNLDLCGSS